MRAERLDRRLLLDGSGFLDPFIVNDPVLGNQSIGVQQQAVAVAQDGSGIVVYAGKGNGDNKGIYARRVDAEGLPIAQPVLVNQTIEGKQRYAAIDQFEDGSSIVVWSGRGEGSGGESDRRGIFARRLDATGQPIGSEFRVNQTRRGVQSQPVVAALDGGAFAVAWAGAGNGDAAGVFARVFDAENHPLAGEHRVNSRARGLQTAPSITKTSEGFAVAFAGSDVDDPFGAFLRHYDHSGAAAHEPIRVHQSPSGFQGSPDVAALPSGETLVVWSGRGAGDGSGIHARVFHSNGQPASDETLVNQHRAGFQFAPTAAVATDGSFLILWNSFASRRGWRGYDMTVRGRHFESIDQPSSDEFSLPNAAGAGGQQDAYQYAPTIASDHQGGYLAAWTHKRNRNEDVVASRMPATDGPDTSPPSVTFALANDTGWSDADRTTADLSLVATVVDQSPIETLSLVHSGTSIDVLPFLDQTSNQWNVTSGQVQQWFPEIGGDGETSLSLVAIDSAGNQSEVSLAVTLDVTAPSQPTIHRIADDTGLSDSDAVTSDSEIRLWGAAEGDARIVIAIDGSTYTIDVDDQGNWESGLINLDDGEYSAAAVAIDRAGNESIPKDDFLVVVDSIAPAPPSIVKITDSLGVEIAGSTADTTIVVTGTSEPLARITLSDVSLGVLAQTTTAADGQWQATLDLGQQVGDAPLELRLSANAIDLAGNASLTSELATVVIGQPSVITPTIIGLDNDTGSSNQDFVTSDNRVIVNGIGRAGDLVTLTVAPTGITFETPIDSSGNWVADLSAYAWNDGAYTLSAVATTIHGETSPADTAQVIIDTTVPAIGNLQLARESDTGIVGDQRTSDSSVVIAGEAEHGAEIHVSGQTSSTTSDGSFELFDVQLSSGRETYTVVASDLAGNTSTASIDLFHEANVTFAESAFVSTTSVELPVPTTESRHSLTFTIDVNTDRSSELHASEDTLNIQLMSLSDPPVPLVTRADGNPSLLSIAGDEVDYDPTILRFDGSNAVVDLGLLSNVEHARLVATWINVDSDSNSDATISRIAIDESASLLSSPFSNAPPVYPVGDQIDLASFQVDTDAQAILRDLRIDPATGHLVGLARIRTGSMPSGRRVAFRFDDLPAGVEVLNASGLDSMNRPYLNLSNATPSGGLAAESDSGSVPIVIGNPNGLALPLRPTVLTQGANQAPVVTDPGPISVVAGGYFEADYPAIDANGDRLRYSIRSAMGLPIANLSADGQLVVTPAPGQEGEYAFDLVVSDGSAETVVPVSLSVTEDTDSTTRVSGIVLSTHSEPIPGISIELGNNTTTTDEEGRFELSVAPETTADTLLIRGEEFIGTEVYPFIAEKIPLLLGRDLYQASNNQIGRPIYLPALDIANGQTVDPTVDTTVTTAAIPGAAVLVKAGSLKDQNGGDFSGLLSITEVPVDVTPAALPAGLFTDLVVTIQPGEMVFDIPAPLTLPNRAGHASGTEMILWSISPITGDFDNVGVGRVSDDGSVIETISGGIRNSSWHDFSTTPPNGTPPENDNNNADKDCDDCENRHEPDALDLTEILNATSNHSLAPNSDAPSTPQDPDQPPTSPPNRFTLSPGASNGFSSWSSGGAASADGVVRDEVFGVATAAGDYLDSSLYYAASANGSQTIDSVFPRAQSAAPASTHESPLTAPEDRQATSVSTHAGALHKSHTLAAYQSQGVGRAVKLVYDSERADPRPIIHSEVQQPGRNIDAPVLVAGMTVYGGSTELPLREPGTAIGNIGNSAGLGLPPIETSDQYRSITPGLDAAGHGRQINELADYPSGRYGYTARLRISGAQNLANAGLTTELDSNLVHINSIDSPIGSGWGIAGLQEIVRNYDGSLLLIDGDGGESVFERVAGEDFFQAPGDFSRIFENGDGTFRRVMTDQTVYQFNASDQLESISDRNGNQTTFHYDTDGRLLRIVDPVGLETRLEYSDGLLTGVVDPADRRTTFQHDQDGNLVQIVDPDASQRQFTYDDEHRLTSETDKNGNSERIEYDFAGRVRQFTRTDGSMIQYSPAQSRSVLPPELTSNAQTAPPAVSLGRQAIASVADANGNVLTASLDRAGQTISQNDPLSNLPEFERGFNNRITRTLDGRGNETVLTYDERGNLVTISDAVARSSGNDSIFAGQIHLTRQQPSHVMLQDVTGDQLLDAVVATQGTGEVAIYAGRGNGGFDLPFAVSVAGARISAAGDFDSDGTVDIAVASDNGLLSLLKGDGNGLFTAHSSVAINADTDSLIALDVDQNGVTDLATLGRSSGVIELLINNADGTFQSPDLLPTSTQTVRLVSVDVNADGQDDLVAVNQTAADNLSVWLSTGLGTYASPIQQTVAAFAPVDIAMADIDGDGAFDVVTTDASSAIAIALGRGDGTFDAADTIPFAVPLPPIPGTPPTSLLGVSDSDGDGDADIVAGVLGGGFATFNNDGSGNLQPVESVFVGGNLPSLAVADINDDGRSDVVAVSKLGRFIRPYLAFSDGSYVDPNQVVGVGLNLPSPQDRIFTADVDNDGLVDLVTQSYLSQTVSILKNNGSGVLSQPTTIALGRFAGPVSVSDANDDGFADLLTPLTNDNEVSIRFGSQFGFDDGVLVELPTIDQPGSIEAGDFDGDGISDLVVTGTNEMVVLRGVGNQDFVPLPPIPVLDPSTQTIVDDFDRDGRLDVVLVGTSTTDVFVTLRLGSNDGEFSPPTRHSFASEPLTAAIAMSHVESADINNDGAPDLVATDPNTNTIRVLVNRGDGTFSDPIATSTSPNPVSLSLRDLNNDNLLDVVVASADASVANVMIGFGDGTFIDRQDYFLTPNPIGATLLDAFGTSDPQIYTIGFGMTSLVTVRNTNPNTSEGFAKQFEYDDQFNQLTRTVDELGNQTLLERDPATGNALSITQVIGEVGGSDDLVTTYSYLPSGQVASMTDPLGRLTNHLYDSAGRLTRTTFAVGTADEAFSELEYDAAGNLTAVINELGHRTEYEFDELNRLIHTVDPDPDGPGPQTSQRRAYEYDGHGNLLQVSDALHGTVAYEYDGLHRRTRKTDALDQSWQYEYDDSGNLVRQTDRLGRVTRYQYDERNRMTAVIDAQGSVQRFIYDADNNPVRRIDNNGNVWVTQFDARNRVVREIDPLGNETVLRYDLANNIQSAVDPLERKTEFFYDDLYRLVEIHEPDPDGLAGPLFSPVRSIEYDRAGNQIRVIDPLGNVVETQYDARNRPIVETLPDPDGSGPNVAPIYVYEYDDANRLSRTSDPLGRFTTYEYDDRNLLVRTTHPDPDGAGPASAPIVAHEYDVAGNLLSTTDALGNRTDYQYDHLYRLISRIDSDPDGVGPLESPITTIAYDHEGQITSVTDPLGRVIAYQYDDLGRTTTEVYPDPDGAGPESNPIVTNAYDPVGNRIAVVDPLGNATRFEYDQHHRLVRVIMPDPDGNGPEANPIAQYQYDAADQTVATVDPLGRRQQYFYDDLGRIVQETYPDPDDAGPLEAPVMTYAYDAIGNQIAMTDSLGNTTDYQFDHLYRRTHVIAADPDGPGPQGRPVTKIEYDVVSRAITAMDPLGRTTQFIYDDLDRVVTEIYPDPDGAGPLQSPQIAFTYDLVGNQTSSTDAVGSITQFEYDNLYRNTATIQADPDGPTGPLTSPITTYTYDVASQPITVTDPLGRTSTNHYDDLGRVVTVIDPDPDGTGPLAAATTHFTFDSVGNQTSTIDPNGYLTQYTYDNLYRRTSQVLEDLDGATGPLGHPTTSYTYDLVGNLLSLTDPSGNTTRWQYDQLDRNTTETISLDGSAVSRRYDYDAMNNLVEVTDRNGRVTRHDYDYLHRPIAEHWIGDTENVIRSITTTYDVANQVLAVEDSVAQSRYDYAYDRLGRAITIDSTNESVVVGLHNEFDAQNRRTRLAANIDGSLDFENTYSYDALHRLSVLTQSSQPGGVTVSPKRFDFDFNRASQLTQLARYADLAGTQTIETSDYAFDGQARLQSISHINSTGTDIAGYQFEYDIASRITQVDSLVDGPSNYGYDNDNQLTSASHTGQANESYTYDENGNRTGVGQTTGDHNRITSNGPVQYEYDNEGNRILRTDTQTGNVTEYRWDHRNRLTEVIQRASAGDDTIHHVHHRYDPFNRWISKSVDVDGDGPVDAETTFYDYDGSNIVLARSGVGVSDRYAWGAVVDQILAEEDAVTNEVVYPLSDHLGSVRDLVDSTGSPINHIQYDSYGNVVSETDAAIDSLFGFTGRPYDESTELQNNHHRWYDAETGNWVSEDPISFASGDTNLTRYTANHPINAIDPDGRVIIIVHGIQNLNNREIAAFAERLDQKGGPKQKIIHFKYGERSSAGTDPQPPGTSNAILSTKAKLNRAAGEELGKLIESIAVEKRRLGSSEPIHVAGYSNGGNPTVIAFEHTGTIVNSTSLLGTSVRAKETDLSNAIAHSAAFHTFVSPGDGATKPVNGIGSHGTEGRYDHINRYHETVVENVFHSLNEASGSHPFLSHLSEERVPGRVTAFSMAWGYDLLQWGNSFNDNGGGIIYATSWLTAFMFENFYYQIWELRRDQDNLFSTEGILPNGTRLENCPDGIPVDYIFYFE